MISPLRIATALRRRLEGDDGMSLAELLVAMSVLLVVMSGVAASVTQALRVTSSNRDRIIATNIAQYELERLRSIPFQSFVNNPEGMNRVEERRWPPDAGDGEPHQTYTVTRDAEWVQASATGGSCTSGTTEPEYVRITQTVEVTTLVGVRPITNQTILRPPVGIYDPYTGHIAVTVQDRSGGPAAGHVVVVSGSGGLRTEISDSYGCAFFPFLQPGTYTVTIATPGHIDRKTLVEEARESVQVGEAVTSTVVFDYDLAAAVELVPEGQYGGSIPTDLRYTLVHAILPGGRLVVPDVAEGEAVITPVVVPGLFPLRSGYGVHAGQCPAADPGSEERTVAASEPGETSTTVVPLATAQIRSAPGVTVFAEQRDDECSDSDQLTLGSTDEAGLLTTAIPYGEWDITDSSGTGSASVTFEPSAPDAYEIVLGGAP